MLIEFSFAREDYLLLLSKPWAEKREKKESFPQKLSA